MKTKFYIIFIIAVAILESCTTETSLEKTLANREDEYWVGFSQQSAHFTYYKFDKKKLVHIYEKENNNIFREYVGEGDIVDVEPEKWTVTQDSILLWGNIFYDIISYSKDEVVLSRPLKTKPYTEYYILIKQKENEFIKYPGETEQKRLKYPKRYQLPK